MYISYDELMTLGILVEAEKRQTYPESSFYKLLDDLRGKINKMIVREIAGLVYDILVKEAGANERDKEMFQFWWEEDSFADEYRFGGLLGFGGKFYISGNDWFISCYPEDKTPKTECIINRTNVLLEDLRKELYGTC